MSAEMLARSAVFQNQLPGNGSMVTAKHLP
jgi:hypothetical protein